MSGSDSGCDFLRECHLACEQDSAGKQRENRERYHTDRYPTTSAMNESTTGRTRPRSSVKVDRNISAICRPDP